MLRGESYPLSSPNLAAAPDRRCGVRHGVVASNCLRSPGTRMCGLRRPRNRWDVLRWQGAVSRTRRNWQTGLFDGPIIMVLRIVGRGFRGLFLRLPDCWVQWRKESL